MFQLNCIKITEMHLQRDFTGPSIIRLIFWHRQGSTARRSKGPSLEIRSDRSVDPVTKQAEVVFFSFLFKCGRDTSYLYSGQYFNHLKNQISILLHGSTDMSIASAIRWLIKARVCKKKQQTESKSLAFEKVRELIDSHIVRVATRKLRKQYSPIHEGCKIFWLSHSIFCNLSKNLASFLNKTVVENQPTQIWLITTRWRWLW